MENIGYYHRMPVYKVELDYFLNKMGNTARYDESCYYAVGNELIRGGDIVAHRNGRDVVTCTPIDHKVFYAAEIKKQEESKKIITQRVTETKLAKETEDNLKQIRHDGDNLAASILEKAPQDLEALVAEGAKKLEELAAPKRVVPTRKSRK